MYTLRADLGSGVTIAANGESLEELMAEFRDKLDARRERHLAVGRELELLAMSLDDADEGDTPTPVV